MCTRYKILLQFASWLSEALCLLCAPNNMAKRGHVIFIHTTPFTMQSALLTTNLQTAQYTWIHAIYTYIQYTHYIYIQL